MHLTDIHIGGGWMSVGKDAKALNTVAAMVTREKPDLVVATGDIAYPVFFQAGTFNNYSGAKAFANLMENLGVYWTVTFGNHDAEAYSYFDRDAVSDFYLDPEYKYCLYQVGPEDVDGNGNHVIEVKNSRGIITQAMVMIDSQAYVDDTIITSIKGTYDNIHDNQVEWYESEIKRMNAENKKIVVLRLWNNGGKDSMNDEILNVLENYFEKPWVEERNGTRIGEKIYIQFGDKFAWPTLENNIINENVFCYGLRDQIGILADGTVVPCCLDNNGEINLGNIFEKDLEEIINSPKAQKIYNGFSNRTAQEELCKRCSFVRKF